MEEEIKDLDSEIQYLSKLYPEVSFAKLVRIVVHATNWQKEHELKKIVNDDLEREIERFKEEFPGEYRFRLTIYYFINWQRMKMMENSFDATVCKSGNTYLKEMNKDAITNVLNKYENGEKVKVLIIKEE